MIPPVIPQGNPPSGQIFNDVPPTHPFYAYIQVLARLGLTTGTSENPPLFQPDAPLTRAEGAVFITRALGLLPQFAGIVPEDVAIT